MAATALPSSAAPDTDMYELLDTDEEATREQPDDLRFENNNGPPEGAEDVDGGVADSGANERLKELLIIGAMVKVVPCSATRQRYKVAAQKQHFITNSVGQTGIIIGRSGAKARFSVKLDNGSILEAVPFYNLAPISTAGTGARETAASALVDIRRRSTATSDTSDERTEQQPYKMTTRRKDRLEQASSTEAHEDDALEEVTHKQTLGDMNGDPYKPSSKKSKTLGITGPEVNTNDMNGSAPTAEYTSSYLSYDFSDSIGLQNVKEDILQDIKRLGNLKAENQRTKREIAAARDQISLVRKYGEQLTPCLILFDSHT